MIEFTKDELWKGVIEDHIEYFCQYFFPEFAQNEADFTRKPEFLEQELNDIVPSEVKQGRIADKIVKIYTKNGKDQWILLHIEVQGYADPDFAERMFTYAYRIREKYKRKIGALAIYTHADESTMPEAYSEKCFGKGFYYDFNVFRVKNAKESDLNKPDNPFSIAMLVVKKALDKNKSDDYQLIWKKELWDAYMESNYSTERIDKILLFIRFYIDFNNEKYVEELNEHIHQHKNNNQNILNITNMGLMDMLKEKVKNYHREQGMKQGMKQGMEQGMKKEREKYIITLLQKEIFSPEQIAETFDISLDEVKAIIQKANI